MKFIVLNPHFQDSGVAAKLKALGVHLLFCTDLREADLVLKIHGRSVSLIIGHDEDGLQLNKIAKSNPKFSDIPVILSFTKWTNDQCVEHQAGSESVNGYLRIPIDESDWMKVVDIVLQTEFKNGVKAEVQDSGGAIEIAGEAGTVAGLRVENAANVYTKSVADQKATENIEGGIELSDLFADMDPGKLLETSGQKAPSTSHSLSSLSADAVDLGEVPFSAQSEILTASPVDSQNSENSVIDFKLDDLGPNPLEGLDLSSDDPISEIDLSPSPDFKSDNETTNPTIDLQSAMASSNNRRATDEDSMDDDAMIEMPYLSSASEKQKFSNLQSHVPLNDALIPGGSANPPDTATLKKYLSLRELDVSTMSQQLQHSKDHISKIETELKKEKANNTELTYLVQEQESRIKNFEKEKQIALESAYTENQELKFEMKKRMDKIRLLDIQVREASQETEKIKDRVRNDIRKIRSREKELENRLEIMRKDSEALLAARENRIIELKRKLDLIEFNMDILQNQYEKEKQLTANFREKLEKAAQVVRVAEGLLHPTEQLDLGDIMTQDLNKDDTAVVA